MCRAKFPTRGMQLPPYPLYYLMVEKMLCEPGTSYPLIYSYIELGVLDVVHLSSILTTTVPTSLYKTTTFPAVCLNI